MEFLICAAIQWDKVGIVLGIVAGLAILFSALILAVTKLCHIDEDEKVLRILENLSGANCGGCGHSGCQAFAKALADGSADLNDCHATSNHSKKTIAVLTGVEFMETTPTVAVVKCNGGLNSANKYSYLGNPGCENQMVMMGGKKVCAPGCIGGGSCVGVCPVGAIRIMEDVSHIDKSLCTSCGACIIKCPKKCIDRVPISAKVYLACSSHQKGKTVSTSCQKGCIACGICVKVCEYGAITMADNLPVFEYDRCTGCLKCVEKCPRKCIHMLRAEY